MEPGSKGWKPTFRKEAGSPMEREEDPPGSRWGGRIGRAPWRSAKDGQGILRGARRSGRPEAGPWATRPTLGALADIPRGEPRTTLSVLGGRCQSPVLDVRGRFVRERRPSAAAAAVRPRPGRSRTLSDLSSSPQHGVVPLQTDAAGVSRTTNHRCERGPTGREPGSLPVCPGSIPPFEREGIRVWAPLGKENGIDGRGTWRAWPWPSARSCSLWRRRKGRTGGLNGCKRTQEDWKGTWRRTGRMPASWRRKRACPGKKE